MRLPKSQRTQVAARTLANMQEHFDEFQTKAGGDIHEPMLDIPINQVNTFAILTHTYHITVLYLIKHIVKYYVFFFFQICVPGLHISENSCQESGD